jgi:4-diphosphocytidyl-2-C-methyl-D-erythritol kinase
MATSHRKRRFIQAMAPAKLNLFLHITGRRADGYHELQTLFQLLDFGDRLLFEETDAPGLSLHLLPDSSYNNVPLDDNLIVRAARLLAQRSERQHSAKISLSKHIPMGAGLGGGSSDAATTLLALNQLWNLGLDRESLAGLGLQLGADVPLFILGKSAWAEGVGEQLQAVELPDAWYVVVMPDCSVSTAEIFTQEHLTRNTTAIKMADFLAGRSRNDCESVTCGLYPEVEKALNWLGQYAPARMTGTGAAVFARFDDEASARAVLAELSATQKGFVAQGVNSSLEPELHDD